ncbi:MAG TPA: biopolymer transporter ExbD [Planctomycetota bacterium]|nr:biopolymer transporter ExbD [Planctomycetota bacterium]
MKIRDADGADEPMFNLTPMIDVVFQLLVFFMVATTFHDPERELEIELPRAESGSAVEAVPEELVINIFRDGSLSLSGRRVDHAGLREALLRAARRDPKTPVTIRGDGSVHHQDVVRVVDACGTAGLSNLAIGTLEASQASGG